MSMEKQEQSFYIFNERKNSISRLDIFMLLALRFPVLFDKRQGLLKELDFGRC